MSPCPVPGPMLQILRKSSHLSLHKILGSHHYNCSHKDEETEVYEKQNQ